MMKLDRKRVLGATVGVALIGACTGAAVASLGFGISPTNLVANASNPDAVHLNSDRVKFQTKDPTDIRVQKVTFDPGGRTGWHHHPGFVLVAVQSGEVTVFDSNCHSKTYGPNSPNGAAFTEYGDAPLEVRSLSTTESATVYATYVAPDANPAVFRIEDDPSSCA